jgi:hypothetical protein
VQTINRRRFNTGLFLGFGLASCAQLPTGAPDLTVTALRWSEDGGATWHTGPIQAGSNVWFAADIKNQGTGPTPDGVIIGVAFLVNNTYVAWSDTRTTALPAGQTLSLRANRGPDGDKYWNNVPAGSYTIRAWVDDINRIPNELDETNNTLDVPVTVGSQQQAAVATRQTLGSVVGGGNFHTDWHTTNQFRYQDLLNLHCSWVRLSLNPNGEYWVSGAPNPTHANTSAEIVYTLQQGLNVYVIFEFYENYPTGSGYPARNYNDWFALGSAFAARFKPNSSFLVSQGITGKGVQHWSAINEPDGPGHDTAGMTYAQYHAMLEGLADGVHSQDATAKVYPAGYLSPNRDTNYTGNGFLSTVADLINDGTLAGFDLHTYQNQYAPIGANYAHCAQHDFDACISACGVTRADIDLVITEWNVGGEPYATSGGYDVELWFLQAFFNNLGLVRPNGTLATGVRLPWNFWNYGAQRELWFASQNNPRVEKEMGITFHWLMNILHNMSFTFADPRGTGVYKLKGGGKSAWVFQNNSSSWSSLFGSTFTISDIPAATTQVQVYDGNGLITTVSVPTLRIPQHTFSTPTGKSYLFIANAEGLIA